MCKYVFIDIINQRMLQYVNKLYFFNCNISWFLSLDIRGVTITTLIIGFQSESRLDQLLHHISQSLYYNITPLSALVYI